MDHVNLLEMGQVYLIFVLIMDIVNVVMQMNASAKIMVIAIAKMLEPAYVMKIMGTVAARRLTNVRVLLTTAIVATNLAPS